MAWRGVRGKPGTKGDATRAGRPFTISGPHRMLDTATRLVKAIVLHEIQTSPPNSEDERNRLEAGRQKKLEYSVQEEEEDADDAARARAPSP